MLIFKENVSGHLLTDNMLPSIQQCVHTVTETLHTGNWVNQPDSDHLNPSVGKWLRAGEEAGDLT